MLESAKNPKVAIDSWDSPKWSFSFSMAQIWSISYAGTSFDPHDNLDLFYFAENSVNEPKKAKYVECRMGREFPHVGLAITERY